MGEECPSCHSKLIGGYGIGTEKVEEEVRRLFPDIRTLRMDRDTTQRKGAHGEILSAFQEGRADCLVGTQMIVKGHDFPKVTVVGILLADMGLFAGDFRSAERTFDLLTQAAGRAGRGDLTGKVMIQTYKPDHYVIETAAGQNYDAFYDFEIAYRRLLFYPPVMQMLGILLTCADESVLIRQADRIAGLLREEAGKEKLMVTGPARAAIYKISDVYRRAIYIRAESEEQLSRIPERLQKENEQLQEEGVEIHFDLAPMHVL